MVRIEPHAERGSGMLAKRLAWSGTRWAGVLAVLFGFGCSGPQSSLDPAGKGAQQIADLFWWMLSGTVVIWAGVVALTYSAIRGRASKQTERQARWYIIGGGAVIPTVVLAALLVYGLSMMPELIAPAPPGTLKIRVVGEQWWWRVQYDPDSAAPVELANEIRLPVGQPVEFELSSPDVIHSFWIPSLGGKMDMIPGRTTRLLLHPTRTGTYRGACAEYCGTSHALMAFDVVVMAEEEFATWLAAQRAPAVEALESTAIAGRDHFFANGCSACHTVRGTEALGTIGPDLTHVGSRLTIGAGTIPNGIDGFRRWIGQTQQVKPDVLMPHFGMLPAEELDALSAYLESLQ
jgi:cytochrome c oxidase subunit 2